MSDISADGLAEGPRFVQRAFPHDLAGSVERITGYQENGQALHLAAEIAAMVVPLVISFSDPFEIALGRDPTADDRYASFTSGLYPGFVLINSTGASQCVQIDFTPLGAYRFFGMPMSEIAGSMVTLEDLNDRGILELRDRISALNNWSARLDIVEEFVRQRIRSSDAVTSPILRAYETIVRRGGNIRVAEIAASLDWSRKHLNERFRELVGVGPKTVSRMIRFNNAVGIARSGTRHSWADVAYAAGYADQAHLTREFVEFSGSTPGRLSEPHHR